MLLINFNFHSSNMAVNTRWTKEDDEALDKADVISKLVSEIALDNSEDAMTKADELLKEIEAKNGNKGMVIFTWLSAVEISVKYINSPTPYRQNWL